MADAATAPAPGGGGSGRLLETLLILAVLAVGGWFVWKRLGGKKADKIQVGRPPATEDKAPAMADTGKIAIDSGVAASLLAGKSLERRGCPPNMSFDAREQRCVVKPLTCPPGKIPGIGGCITGYVESTDYLHQVAEKEQAEMSPLAKSMSKVIGRSVVKRPAPKPALNVTAAAAAALAPVTTPVGAVISSQPAPPASSPKPAAATLFSASRPAAVLIKPLPLPKPTPPPPTPPKTAPTFTVAKPPTGINPAPALASKPAMSTSMTTFKRRF